MTEQQLLDLLEVSSMSSNVTFSGPSLSQRNIKEINWFKNSINIRKDAIPAYKDYHNNFRDIFNTYDDEDCDESDEVPGAQNWDVIPKDEVELHHHYILEKTELLSLKPSESEEDSKNERMSESTQISFSAPKPQIKHPIDWFAGTIQVKKCVIEAYNDYHEEKEEENTRGVQFKGDVEYIEVDSGYNDEDDDESLDSASVLESNLMKRRSTVCQNCEAPIIGRNLYLENIAKKLVFV